MAPDMPRTIVFGFIAPCKANPNVPPPQVQHAVFTIPSVNSKSDPSRKSMMAFITRWLSLTCENMAERLRYHS